MRKRKNERERERKGDALDVHENLSLRFLDVVRSVENHTDLGERKHSPRSQGTSRKKLSSRAPENEENKKREATRRNKPLTSSTCRPKADPSDPKRK